MYTRFRLIAALGVVAVALLGMASQASAAAKAPLYKLTVKGSQVITWSQFHAPQFECDATVTGNGSQSITYETFDPVKVELIRPKGLPALFAEPKDALAPYGLAEPVVGYASAEREGYQDIQSPGGTCNGTGGGGQGPPPDCGQRSGFMRMGLSYATVAEATPTATNTTEFLKLTGPYNDFAIGYSTDDDVLGLTFENCPFWISSAAGAATDELLVAGEKVPVAKVAKLAVGKTLKVSASEEQSYGDGDFTGKTINAWNLSLKRVR